MRIMELNQKEILMDFFFCFSASTANPHLRQSVQTSGIRTPVHAVSHENGFRLVSGFKRLAVSRDLGLETIPAEIVEYSAIPDVLIDVIREQLSHSELTLPEKARIVGIFEKLNVNRKTIDRRVLPLLNLSVRQNLYTELQQIRGCTETLQRYLEQYNVSLRQSSLFLPLNPDEQALAMKLANALQLRPVELSEIFTLMLEIGSRESVTLTEVFDNTGMPAVLSGDALNRNEKTKILKEILQKKRFPKLNQWRDDLTRLTRALSLPGSAVIAWDNQLEQPGVRMNASFSSLKEVRAAGECLLKDENQEIWEKIFNLV